MRLVAGVVSLLVAATITNTILHRAGVRVEDYDPEWPWIRKVAYRAGIRKVFGPLWVQQVILLTIMISFPTFFAVLFGLEYLSIALFPESSVYWAAPDTKRN